MAPSEQEFYIEWEDSLRSEWNRAAIELIVNYVIRGYPAVVTETDRPAITKAAFDHIKYLKATYVKRISPDERKRSAAAQHSRSRKREVSEDGSLRGLR